MPRKHPHKEGFQHKKSLNFYSQYRKQKNKHFNAIIEQMIATVVYYLSINCSLRSLEYLQFKF